jgi:hypothetical protein
MSSSGRRKRPEYNNRFAASYKKHLKGKMETQQKNDIGALRPSPRMKTRAMSLPPNFSFTIGSGLSVLADRALAIRHGAHGRTLAERYSWAHLAERIQAVLLDAAASQPWREEARDCHV